MAAVGNPGPVRQNQTLHVPVTTLLQVISDGTTYLYIFCSLYVHIFWVQKTSNVSDHFGFGYVYSKILYQIFQHLHLILGSLKIPIFYPSLSIFHLYITLFDTFYCSQAKHSDFEVRQVSLSGIISTH